jgi:septal ring factor EnvC (AmiA/AmiB activator)
MPRVLLALLVLFGAPACQQAAASRGDTFSARDRQVSARLDGLDRQLRALRADQQHLVATAGKASARIASLARRLDAAAAKLGHLQGKVAGVDSAAAAATASAGSAGAQAAELARRLAILEKRFEYHLKHDPGSS